MGEIGDLLFGRTRHAARRPLGQDERVEDGQHQHREQRRRDEAADHHHGERPLGLGADPRREGGGEEAERREQRRHEDGAQAARRAGFDRGAQPETLGAQRVDLRNQHHAVQHHLAHERNEADAG